jgi:hypothetical protein
VPNVGRSRAVNHRGHLLKPTELQPRVRASYRLGGAER